MDKKNTKVISSAIYKGGAGKSSLSGNLAYSLKTMGFNVLLIDTDAQMNLSHSYGLRSSDKNFHNVLMDKDNILDNITKTAYPSIDFVISSVALANIEMQMSGIPFSQHMVIEALQPVIDSGEYDFIIIDTSPSLGLLNSAILYATDYVIVPVEATSFGVEGLEIFMEYFNNVKKYKKDLDILGIVMNKIDKRENLSVDAKEVVKSVFGDILLKTEIPSDTNIKNSQWAGIPIGLYKKDSRAALCFDELAKEVVMYVKEGKRK